MFFLHEGNKKSLSFLLGHTLHKTHGSPNSLEAFTPPPIVVEISQQASGFTGLMVTTTMQY